MGSLGKNIYGSSAKGLRRRKQIEIQTLQRDTRKVKGDKLKPKDPSGEKPQLQTATASNGGNRQSVAKMEGDRERRKNETVGV